MAIHKILGLKKTSKPEDIKKAYIKKLFLLHPDRKNGSEKKYIELKEEYERYLRGENMQENYFAVFNKSNTKDIICRCGGRYDILNEDEGRIDCEYCSCFIEIQDDLLALNEIN